jgi:hypothetical protein
VIVEEESMKQQAVKKRNYSITLGI